MLIGYARVSKGDEQTTAPQLRALKDAGVEKTFEENASGGRWDRPRLHAMIEQLREGDVVVVWKLDRLSRSLKDLLHLLDRIEAAGAGFRSLTESIDTTTPAGRMMMQMVGSFAEFERAMIRERTSAGLEAARAEGRVGGRRPKLTPAQRADTMLGYRFAPRIRDLPDKRLYAFEPNAAPATVRPLIAARVRTELIERNWPDLLRLAASMALGTVRPSAILRRLAAYPRANELAQALREVGRVERSLFLLRWITDADLQRHAQLGINKGEAHHALKRAIALGRHGEIRDRLAEGQHHRMAGLNLVAAAIVHWNTRQLSTVVAERTTTGNAPDPVLLPHVSPLGWEHIHLTGEYRWPA